jgi:hypothetical protein
VVLVRNMDIFGCGDEWIQRWEELQSGRVTELPLESTPFSGAGTSRQGQDWLFHIGESVFDNPSFVHYYPELNIEVLENSLPSSAISTDDTGRHVGSANSDQELVRPMFPEDALFSKILRAELVSDRGSSDGSEVDEIPTPTIDKEAKPRTLQTVFQKPLLETPIPLPLDQVPLDLDIPTAVSHKINTITGLLQLTDVINKQRGFNNLKDHKWLPAGSEFNFTSGYRPIWSRVHDARDPSLFVAILRQGDNGTLEEAEQSDSGLNDKARRVRAPRGRGKAKKKKSSLKSWDPIEVEYPLGYIPFQKWFHMRDLKPEQMYSFNTEEFKSMPDCANVTVERQNDPDMMQNKYDSFYLRVHPKSNERECYCGCCESWHKRDQCNWLHHMKSAHGIRSCTKQRYGLPHIMSERPDKKASSGMFIGFCDKCQSWQNVNNTNGQNNYASWFLHQASHDVQRNKMEGRTGKKRSKKEIEHLRKVIKESEDADRQTTKQNIIRLMTEERALNGDQSQFTGKFFSRSENYLRTKESQDIDDGV